MRSTQDGQGLIDAARELAPLLAEHATAAEAQRRPADVVIEALRASRIFDLMVPEVHGGLGLDLDTFVEVGLALAEGDASMAWVASFYIEHNWMLCQFPMSFQKELYRSCTHVLAPAAIAPVGFAEPTDGGFRLSGRWHWGTGVMHADWVIVGALSTHADDAPEMRLFALPIEEVVVDDVWFTDGMCGTGSNDIVIAEAVVPAERTVSAIELSNGVRAPVHDTPLYRTPMLPILSLAAAMPAVGQARAALRGFQAQMHERTLFGTGSKQVDKPAAQIRLGRAEVEVRQAEQLVRSLAAEAMALRGDATIADRGRMTASAAVAVDQSKRVIQSISAASGAHAHFTSHPLQRALRDVQTLACHVVFDLDARLELHGRTMLGLEPAGLV